jgi:hypothetical protein
MSKLSFIGLDLHARSVAVSVCEEAASEPWAGVVGRLSCLRGVSTLTAFELAAEIGDRQRFDGRSIGANLGLTPSESSSGERRRQGAITKTGNGHARSRRRDGHADSQTRARASLPQPGALTVASPSNPPRPRPCECGRFDVGRLTDVAPYQWTSSHSIVSVSRRRRLW